MNILRRQLAAAALVPLVAPVGAAAVQGVSPPGQPEFPNVVLIDQHGQPVRFYDDLLRGDHTVAINFIYAQCADICPATTANLARVQALLGDRLGREVRMASISID